MADKLGSESCVVRKEKKHSHVVVTDPQKGRLKKGTPVAAADALGSAWTGKVLSNPPGDGKRAVLSLRCTSAVHPVMVGHRDRDDLTPSTLTVTLNPGTSTADMFDTTVTYVEDDPDACND